MAEEELRTVVSNKEAPTMKKQRVEPEEASVKAHRGLSAEPVLHDQVFQRFAAVPPRCN